MAIATPLHARVLVGDYTCDEGDDYTTSTDVMRLAIYKNWTAERMKLAITTVVEVYPNRYRDLQSS